MANDVTNVAVANAPAPDVVLNEVGTTGTVQDAAVPQAENVIVPVGPDPLLTPCAGARGTRSGIPAGLCIAGGDRCYQRDTLPRADCSSG